MGTTVRIVVWGCSLITHRGADPLEHRNADITSILSHHQRDTKCVICEPPFTSYSGL